MVTRKLVFTLRAIDTGVCTTLYALFTIDAGCAALGFHFCESPKIRPKVHSHTAFGGVLAIRTRHNHIMTCDAGGNWMFCAGIKYLIRYFVPQHNRIPRP
jgi:hypothetical protein